jgi:hypothetical protein
MAPSRSALTRAVLLLTVTGACNPYDRFGANDDSLGPVDPVNFPAASLGTGGNRKMPGNGSVTAVRAFSAGMPIQYFNYPFPPATPDNDPLRLVEDDAPYLAVPTAYSFPGGYQCTPPAGYMPDPRLDERPLNVQDNIFTSLPTATYNQGVASRSSYVPVVADAAVTGAGLQCQKAKSADQLKALLGGMAPKPAGTYQAWAIIDPAAAVYGVGQNAENDGGITLQRWGWFNRYLLAYLDGGPIPTMDTTVMEGTPPMAKKVTRMVTQRLYYPRSMVMGATAAAAGRLGAGYDVIAARRGAAGYSPVCEVFTYDAGMAPVAAADLPKDAAAIEAMFMATLRPGANPYVFCLQVVTP